MVLHFTAKVTSTLVITEPAVIAGHRKLARVEGAPNEIIRGHS